MYPLAVVPFRVHLSKSRFCQGLQCHKQLWLRVHEPDAPELAVDPKLQAVFDRGHLVGEAARERFPGGVLVEGDHREPRRWIEQTRRALAGGAGCLFEAAFEADGVFVAVDVLERTRRGFVFAEVKSTLEVKEPHVPDVAIQLHVARRAGLAVRRADVMHLNRDCTHPDLSNLFVRENVTAAARALLPSIPRQIRRMQRMLAGPCPPIEPGDQCIDPYPCPFIERCWPRLPRHHVSTLYRIGRRRADQLVADGYELIRDLPEDLPLSPPAGRQRRAVRSRKLVVEPGLAAALEAIRPPVAFLDFETVSPPIPVWPGCHPYQAVPVQLSCHVAGGRGARHHAFLAEAGPDPRPAVADAVARACGDARTVVAWNARFEADCLAHLAEAVPGRRSALLTIRERLVDLLPIVRDHVYHPDFLGSFSLKAVAPALGEGVSYDALAIADGDAASAALEALLLRPDTLPAGERRRLRKELLCYCAQDTLALVKIHERLGALVGLPPRRPGRPPAGSRVFGVRDV